MILLNNHIYRLNIFKFGNNIEIIKIENEDIK